MKTAKVSQSISICKINYLFSELDPPQPVTEQMLPEDPAEERRAWQGRLLEDRPGLLQELGQQRGGQAGHQASGGEEAEQEEHQDPDQFHVWGARGGGGSLGAGAWP